MQNEDKPIEWTDCKVLRRWMLVSGVVWSGLDNWGKKADNDFQQKNSEDDFRHIEK